MGTMEAPLPTPASVWAGFDPTVGPLEEEILRYNDACPAHLLRELAKQLLSFSA